MSESGKELEGHMPPLGWATQEAPAEPAAGEPAPTAEQPPLTQPAPSRGNGRTAAAMVLIVLAAAAAGTAVGHSYWSATQTTTVATGGGSGFVGGSSFSGGTGLSGRTGTPGSGARTNTSSVAAAVSPAIVNINSTFSYQSGAGAGTGIVLGSDGEVLTNNHVIDGATKITATDVGNGRTYSATVVGYDPSHDIAVLQLQGASGLATARIGDSSKLSVGDPIVGLGNAGGSGGSPTIAAGSITGLGRSITAGDELGGKTERLSGLIQVNAPIQAGDSGGPLVDSQGRVIGMDTAGSAGFGFGFGSENATQAFAIPIEQAAKTANQIELGQSSSTIHVGATAFLGVMVAPSQSAGGLGFGSGIASPNVSGVTVGGVVSGKPAQKAGLVAGDVITSVDGKSVGSDSALSGLMLAHHPGDLVKLDWTDGSGQSHTASVPLTEGPPA
jgi:S1-C subfamily serine protease